jgi:hypothetical protein
MEFLLSLKSRGCGKAGVMEILKGFPQPLEKGSAFFTFPHPIFINIKIGHFYFAQNRTFLFWVDISLRVMSVQIFSSPSRSVHDLGNNIWGMLKIGFEYVKYFSMIDIPTDC